ncbi:MAG TPA: histidine kinase dimerization/phospho-acceptor domain-containing protein [Fimbriimonadaceae bacterium]|jgi:signal transduction histidine kinase
MRSRTTAGFVIIIGIVLACTITTLLALARSSGELESQDLLKDVASKTKLALQDPAHPEKAPDFKDPQIQAKLTALANSPEVLSKNIYILVIHRDRRPRRDDSQANRDSQPPPPETPPTILYQNRQDSPALRPFGDPAKETSLQKKWDENWTQSGNLIGHGIVALAIRSTRGVERDLNKRRLDLMLMGGFVVLAVGFGAWFVVGLTLSPIRKLAKQAASASTENLNVRLEAPSNDAEVVELVDTLNVFLQNMADTAESKGRFYAAASHELRTPLQALSGHLELALSRERPAEDYKQALEEAKKQSGRLKSLVQSLLLLHQLENNQLREKDQINLTSACKSTLQHLQPTIAARDLKVEIDAPEDFSVPSISNHAEILARNLLENAVKYATCGKKVKLTLRNAADAQEMEVFDECEPIPNWSSEKVEAFYRPDSARNAKTGGNGLGLAICRAIAQANRWVLVVDEVEGGFLATVKFGSAATLPAPGKGTGKEKAVATKPEFLTPNA